jgi:hypothetical protein
MIKKLLPYIVVGMFIRLLLIPTAIHPDIRGFNIAASLISQQGKVFTFYDYISHLPRSERLVQIYGDDLFIYPPLAYLSHAAFMKVLSPLYPWQAFDRLIMDIGQARGFPGIIWLLYLLKFPYLVIEGIGLYLILKVVPEKHKLLAGKLWILNPVTIYASYMISQFDIFIAVFLLAALYFAQRGKTLLAAVSLGIAAGFKPFPLFLLSFIPTLPGVWPRLKVVAIGVATYLLIIAPYLAISPGFRQYALLANQSDKLLYAKVMVSGSQYLSLFFAGIIILAWINLLRPQTFSHWGWFAAVPLVFYSLSHYHPQWFVWGSPFLILAAVYRRSLRWPIAVLLLCYIVIIFLFEPSLNFGMFDINFNFSVWLAKYFPPDQLASMVRSLFAATSVFIIFGFREPSPSEE